MTISCIDLSLVGERAPVMEICQRIDASQIPVGFHQGAVSPHTRLGAAEATADLYPDKAEVYLPHDCSAHQIFHELLHIERTYTLRIPSLVAAPGWSKGHVDNITWLNNDFEHMAVIRQEVDTYPEAASYWEADFARMLDEMDWGLPSNDPDASQQKLTLLRTWAVVSTALHDSSAAKRIWSLITARHLGELAQRMSAEMRRAGNDTSAKVKAFFAAAPYFDLESVQLQQYQPALKNFVQVPL